MKVYLLSRPRLEWEAFEQFEEDEGLGSIEFEGSSSDAETLVEMAGRLCYMSYGKGRKTNKEFIENIIKQKHFSVLEHANWTLLITGVSRSLTHELVRHRHFSYSQLSQRYVDHTNMPIIAPPGMPLEMSEEWDNLMLRVRRFYSKVNVAPTTGKVDTLKVKAVRTIARSVLPNAMTTKIVVTGNARAWREFIEKRAQAAADPEIHALATEVYRKLSAAAPTLFGDLLGGPECVST